VVLQKKRDVNSKAMRSDGTGSPAYVPLTAAFRRGLTLQKSKASYSERDKFHASMGHIDPLFGILISVYISFLQASHDK